MGDFLDPSALTRVDNPFDAMLFLIQHGGWVVLVITTMWGIWIGWLEYIRNRYDASVEFALLAIDIPKNNEQSPKAVEHIFSHFTGIQKHGTLYERYVKGYNQQGFSLEIVSIEGYIQFLIRTPKEFRDLVEAATYAQYPDAEITEVEDYIDSMPKPLELPHKDYDLYGTEFKLERKDVYPIKTYPQWEHPLTQTFLDPMASLLEIMSRFGPGEQLWLQIVIAPIDPEWRKRGIALIRKLIGKKSESKGTDWFYFPREVSRGLTESITSSIIPPSEGQRPEKKEREWPSLMQHLSPDERATVEAIGYKIAKIGFLSKIRMVYYARKEVMQKSKGVNAIVGAIKQFNTLDLNAFKVDKKSRTKVYYVRVKNRLLWRQRRILWGYRYRSLKRGRNRYVLNTEELASIFHFPVMTVRAPLVQKAQTKKSEPPSKLPIEHFFNTPEPVSVGSGVQTAEERGTPPANLPFA
ncbi:MAG: hypothetical protein A2898_04125 [Candidatus Kerfeldbacteria bacterium RIFCSPLOWO2_01_FULL_48_11]|uniref:DUF8128 domain-containing protein n=1 Tax=Candidatus Kerfeldbacteria bacterium RIFCSPLOWO2_01_FULL_48_11 TaxID=1798543 RepID=A0A1G2B1X6_9BACT|nr:MAG: hypothetical protein UY34_C0001G0029 [Parcubacteria group bacterium GW2011_GWA2_48_9]KKW16335.1 MAG: hypothetical protein UY52_C0006G0016 [Parcubacteria group bacterium GW2011_GWC2_49_9]OGY82756.1 MAG: hypothetical protein A2898_04125 [Candidatus Kerfeldbacteria bacterium RIFCSPLOWO2_01_FULL_48_11]HCJ52635.1 hypothetical protein [Candidatus Kerfeldbacteria bacterium]HCM67903.1 hypothetical protein [Candidatus Kerfeldbacteria bacterium]